MDVSFSFILFVYLRCAPCLSHSHTLSLSLSLVVPSKIHLKRENYTQMYVFYLYNSWHMLEKNGPNTPTLSRFQCKKKSFPAVLWFDSFWICSAFVILISCLAWITLGFSARFSVFFYNHYVPTERWIDTFLHHYCVCIYYMNKHSMNEFNELGLLFPSSENHIE